MNERETRILEALEQQGTVQVGGLAEALGVSAVTIRKDLESLEQRRLLRRIRGGATRPQPHVEGEFPERMAVSARAKKAVAVAAAELIEDGDTVAFDTSSTAHFIAREVLGRRDLVVITQSLPTATLFFEMSSAQVIMPGGILRRESSGLVGTRPEHLVGRGRIAKGFFGVTGLSAVGGLLELGLDESESKRVLAEACDEVYGVFSSDKASGFGFHSFCPVESVTGLITDEAFPAAAAAEWEAAGVGVRLAPLSPPAARASPLRHDALASGTAAHESENHR